MGRDCASGRPNQAPQAQERGSPDSVAGELPGKRAEGMFEPYVRCGPENYSTLPKEKMSG